MVCLLTIGFFNVASSQIECAVHLDKSFYVTGELIWYKLILPPTMMDNNAAIKTSLVKENGSTVGDHFNFTNGETYITGYFKLPIDLTSEVYTLVFSAARKKNELEEILAEIFIPVYNDLEDEEPEDLMNVSDLESYNQGVTENQNLLVTIALDKDLYHTREKVNAQIEVRDTNGNPVVANISVSVTDAELIDHDNDRNTLYQGNPLLPDDNREPFLEKIYIMGSSLRTDGEINSNRIISVFENGKNKLQFTLPEPSTGKFLVEFPKFHNKKSIQFIPLDLSDNDLQIVLRNVNKKSTKKLSYNQSVRDYLKLSRQRKKLFRRYALQESNIEPKEYSSEALAFKAAKSYDISRYTSFENIASFLTEVSTPLRMRKKNGLYEGNMFMDTGRKHLSDYAKDPPIYILNGYLTRNSDFVGNLSMDVVDNIAMMNNPMSINKEYRLFGTAGVVELQLKSNSIKLPDSDLVNVFKISGLLPESDFPVFDPKEIGYDEYLPFFRPQLFWNGNLKTDNYGNLTIEFYQSDDVSTFIINVVAHAADGSITLSQSTYRSVW